MKFVKRCFYGIDNFFNQHTKLKKTRHTKSALRAKLLHFKEIFKLWTHKQPELTLLYQFASQNLAALCVKQILFSLQFLVLYVVYSINQPWSVHPLRIKIEFSDSIWFDLGQKIFLKVMLGKVLRTYFSMTSKLFEGQSQIRKCLLLSVIESFLYRLLTPRKVLCPPPKPIRNMSHKARHLLRLYDH